MNVDGSATYGLFSGFVFRICYLLKIPSRKLLKVDN